MMLELRPHCWLIIIVQIKTICLLKHTGHFEKGVAEGAVDPSFNPVVALRLSVLKESAVWAILSEVSQSNTSPVNVLSIHTMKTTRSR